MTTAHLRPLPTTIPDYLVQLRQALSGADPAMIQDALYDAEEYLRAELAEQKGKSEADVIAGVAGSYGAPEEVAEIYRETEVTVSRALRPPLPPRRSTWLGKFFGVAADPRTYGALFYMLLSLVTGVFYFTWVVTGTSLSLGLLILIIGVPLLVLFFGSVRVLSLVEGRVVEALLGVRMPRRPQHPGAQGGWLQRIGAMFTDARTWSTMLYFLLMLPLGIVYFTVFITLLSLSLGLAASPFIALFDTTAVLTWDGVDITGSWLTLPLFGMGVLLMFVTLHLARAFGKLHGMFAKHLLVKSGEG
ncbi:sensor domain-containing protein [Xanthomonas floridensis]|uniref:Sensor domain-containing protein n=2 Tax=Xanthomonas floridensis TaxID=1843580 RepID=A0ABU5Q066_9XANT|nr:sensor domain-containing protein [Xanthomonas floridensis]MEA5125248.1 sensor domain-containing protein [Xanthomonas floridensis]MEA5132965.1 sensor domain-containing protein [Xanthomonas floridensis]